MIISFRILSMITLLQALWDKFSALLSESTIPENEHSTFRKWLHYYLDFCHKYNYSYVEQNSLPFFVKKLESKYQSKASCEQAIRAVSLYYQMQGRKNHSLMTLHCYFFLKHKLKTIYITGKDFMDNFDVMICLE